MRTTVEMKTVRFLLVGLIVAMAGMFLLAGFSVVSAVFASVGLVGGFLLMMTVAGWVVNRRVW